MSGGLSNLSVNLKERQRDALKKMLSLNMTDSEDDKQRDTGFPVVWKALVYDEYCQDIIAPLLYPIDLQKLGVTVHFPITAKRERVRDVAAIYFVRPTAENIDRIAKDLSAGLYDVFYLNFSTSIPHALIERLAAANLKSKSGARIARIFDQYTEFVSLETSLVHLNHRNSYVTLNDAGAGNDNKLMSYIDSVVESLFSIAVTWGVPPIIRCRSGEAAQEAATKLHTRLQNHLVSKNNLFASTTSATYHRPVLILLDRNVDLTVPLQHPSTYQALLHDMLDMESNRVKVRVEADAKSKDSKSKDAAADSGSARGGKVWVEKKYDLNDPTDTFWAKHAGNGFSNIGDGVSAMIKEFEQSSADITKTGTSPEELARQLDNPLAGLTNAITLLPELKLQKALIDRHTNLAHALLELLKERRIDTYFQAEEDIMSKLAFGKAQLLEHIGAEGTGTVEDKLRLLMIYYLCNDVNDTDFKELKGALRNKTSKTDAKSAATAASDSKDAKSAPAAMDLSDDFFAPLMYLKKWKFLNRIGSVDTAAAAPPKHKKNESLGYLDRLTDAATKVATHVGTRVLGKVNEMMALVAAAKDLPVTRIVDALMTNKESVETEKYLYFDPRLKSKSALARDKGRATAPFRDAFVCVLGGGNFTEFQNLTEYARKQSTAAAPRTIIYGCTEIVSPKQFLAQLSALGHEGGAANGTAAAGTSGKGGSKAFDAD